MSADRVTVAYVHPNELSASFHESLLGLIMYDAGSEGHLLHPDGKIDVRCGTDGLVAGRNEVVARFLETDIPWLLWIDADMGFAPDSLDRLLEVADPADRPIVGGLCFASKEYSGDAMGGYRTSPRPTIFTWQEYEGKRTFLGAAHYPVNKVVLCDGTGSAFVLIHRNVLEAIHAKHGTWYDRVPGSDGKPLGEDISFCLRARVLGFPIAVHTGIRTTHHKPQWVGEEDYWRAYLAPPATEAVAVLVPVMKRPANAAPFMASLRASTGLAKVYAIAHFEDDETIDAWRNAGATIVQGPETTFAQKVNAAFLVSASDAPTAPWLFLCGDDVRFRPGWLDHAENVAKIERASVVGTNDLLNPRVLAGSHATHMLIARSYVESEGAGWDGPGTVCHSGYKHWFVDDEIVHAAKQRGVFAMALGSVVEHLHPLAGKAEDDEVYRLGQSHARRDQELFTERLRTSLKQPLAV